MALCVGTAAAAAPGNRSGGSIRRAPPHAGRPPRPPAAAPAPTTLHVAYQATCYNPLLAQLQPIQPQRLYARIIHVAYAAPVSLCCKLQNWNTLFQVRSVSIRTDIKFAVKPQSCKNSFSMNSLIVNSINRIRYTASFIVTRCKPIPNSDLELTPRVIDRK